MSTPLIIPLNAGAPTLLIELYLYILELSEPHPDGRTAVQWLLICRAISHWVRQAPQYRALRNRLRKHVQWFRSDSMDRFCQVKTQGRATQLMKIDSIQRVILHRNIKNAFQRRYKIAQDDVNLFDRFCEKISKYAEVYTHLHVIFTITAVADMPMLQLWQRAMPDFLSFTVVVNTVNNFGIDMFSYRRRDTTDWCPVCVQTWICVFLKLKVGICHHQEPSEISLAGLKLPFKKRSMQVSDTFCVFASRRLPPVELGWFAPHIYFDYDLDKWRRKKYGFEEPDKVLEADIMLVETAVGPIRLTPWHDETRQIDMHLLWFNKIVTLRAPIKPEYRR